MIDNIYMHRKNFSMDICKHSSIYQKENKADNSTIGAEPWLLFNLNLRILSFKYC